MKSLLYQLFAIFSLPFLVTAQVNSGSNGSDGAFNPTQSVENDIADHPDGIYHYTSVNVEQGRLGTRSFRYIRQHF